MRGKESDKILTSSVFNAVTIGPTQLYKLQFHRIFNGLTFESFVALWEQPCFIRQRNPNRSVSPLDVANDLQEPML